MNQPKLSPRFRPELGLPWLAATMQGLSPEQIEKNIKGCRPFLFRNNAMAPAFPEGTQVVLRPVECKCKLAVGKVYVLFTKGGEFVAYGRLVDMLDSEEVARWGVQLTLQWEDGRECMPPWIWPHPGHILYAVAYYDAIEVTAL